MNCGLCWPPTPASGPFDAGLDSPLCPLPPSRSGQRRRAAAQHLAQNAATEAPALRATGTDGANSSTSVDSAYTILTPKSDSGCVSLNLVENGEEDAPRTRESISANRARALRADENCCGELREEAPPGFEPGIADLQSAALPLGEGAASVSKF